MSVIYGRFILIPQPGEALADPEKWNSDWEAVFQEHPEVVTPEYHFECELCDNKKSTYSLNKTLDRYSTNLLGSCSPTTSRPAGCRPAAQSDSTQFFAHDLEARWLSASRAIRRKHLLGALAAICSRAGNLNATRGHCVTELDLPRLSSDGQSFLDLLRSALLDDSSVIPNKPRYIAHPEWDAFSAKQEARTDRTDEEKVAWAEVYMLRTKLICHVLHYTLCTFFDLAPLELRLERKEKKAWKRDDPLQHVYDALQTRKFGPEIAQERKKLQAADHKDRNTGLRNACSYPGCTNLSPADGSSKFKHCPRCYEGTQRRVLYCSPICQKADWKLRHKAVCGKALSFEDVATVPDIPLDERLRSRVASIESDPEPVSDAINTIPMPAAHQAVTDAVKWDHAWEILFRGPPFVSTLFCFVDMVNRNESHGLEATLSSYPYLLSNTCFAQYQLTLDAHACFKKGFEARWRAASPGDRYPHVLGALAAVCSKSQNLNMGRAYCGSELRVEPLCEQREIFIELLRSAMLDAVPSQPKYIPSESWDGIVYGDGDEEEGDLVEVTLAGPMLIRTKVVCYVLNFILRSFCGMETPILTASKVEDVLDRELQGESPVTVESIKERTIERRASCSYLKCLKLAPASTGASSPFQRCGRCSSQN
ncbi:hypothetical protein FB45DRAFT_1063527 [Roridomyces roridus]|uniref:MYND-type domain-containing protein n=1 Tax=Roridomyces roridus TaxID=1738132 RepID=A0AAD7FDU2_9AGAR|nr:hypothetical protein FB45DRAFT_1063527 [Roridomyces roridus]